MSILRRAGFENAQILPILCNTAASAGRTQPESRTTAVLCSLRRKNKTGQQFLYPVWESSMNESHAVRLFVSSDKRLEIKIDKSLLFLVGNKQTCIARLGRIRNLKSDFVGNLVQLFPNFVITCTNFTTGIDIQPSVINYQPLINHFPLPLCHFRKHPRF